MKKRYDFSKGKRGAVIAATGKTRITIYVDEAIIERFKAQSEKTGKGYQTLINEALKSYVGLAEEPAADVPTKAQPVQVPVEQRRPENGGGIGRHVQRVLAL